ncbi:hypothetical protein [Pelotomaculum propionicicum]|uniref:hypothetical protein n=1 Tax=Pelotomaculum propionicicum TaxID=258475 RepID=UPI001065AF41|nr:hypothetical protein [Pelotomaculum propionicicum]
MDHPVGQRRGHLVADAFILGPVARRHLAPSFRQEVFTDTPVQDQLVGGSLHSPWGGGNLVIKYDTFRAVAPDMGQEGKQIGFEYNGANRMTRKNLDGGKYFTCLIVFYLNMFNIS